MEKIKILIFGANGMAGHIIAKYLERQDKYHIIKTARESKLGKVDYVVDVTNFELVNLVIKEVKPVYVINAIGILNSFAEMNKDQAILINSYFPHFLANSSRLFNFKLVHISTDCVFNGEKGSYKELDLKNGYGFYAQSKALGEVLYNDALTIRTSIIGPELKSDGIGLFDWVLNQENEIVGFKNAFWSGVTTLELAKFINFFIQENNFIGLYHLTNNKKISKFELISLINAIYNLNLRIIPDFKYVIDKSLVNTRQDIDYVVPSYANMIKDLKLFTF